MRESRWFNVKSTFLEEFQADAPSPDMFDSRDIQLIESNVLINVHILIFEPPGNLPRFSFETATTRLKQMASFDKLITRRDPRF